MLEQERIKEIERLIGIHENFMEKQYPYDRSLVMERFEKLEKQVAELMKLHKELIPSEENGTPRTT